MSFGGGVWEKGDMQAFMGAARRHLWEQLSLMELERKSKARGGSGSGSTEVRMGMGVKVREWRIFL